MLRIRHLPVGAEADGAVLGLRDFVGLRAEAKFGKRNRCGIHALDKALPG